MAKNKMEYKVLHLKNQNRMLKIMASMFLFLSLLSAAFLVSSEKVLAEETGYRENEVIVGIQRGNARAELTGLLADGEVLLELPDDTDEAEITASGEETENSNLIMLVSHSQMSVEELIKEISSYPEVIYAEPNYEIYSENYSDMTRFQWGLKNNGQQNGVSGIDYSMPDLEMSDQLDGSVAVIMDSGIDYTNPDLSGRMWHKSDNAAWASLGGGEYGYNARISSNHYDEGNVMDDYYHGTHCAGILASSWNGQGTSGISNNAKLMAVKILSEIGKGNISDAIRGYDYLKTAREAGVPITVVNNSWGVDKLSRSLNDSVTMMGKLGAVSAFASGNAGKNVDTITDMVQSVFHNPYAIVVNAIDSNGNPASYSNYSSCYTDIAAPGTGILSSVPMSHSTYLAEAASNNLLYNDFETQDNEWKLMNSANEVLPVSASRMFEGSYSQESVIETISQEYYTTPVSLNTNGAADLYFSLHLYSEDNVTLNGKAAVLDKNNTWVEVSALSNLTGQQSRENRWGTLCGKLPENTNFDSFQIRISITASSIIGSENHVYFDCMGVGTERIPYDYQSGTSMATPSVSGEIAMLAAMYPSDSIKKTAARVIGSAICTEQLDGTSVSGGYASFKNAENPNPVLSGVEKTGGFLKVNGFFFGNSPGCLMAGEKQLDIVNWSEESIIAVCDPDTLIEKTKIEVTTAKQKSGYTYEFFEAEETADAYLSYAVQVQDIGWMDPVKENEETGTVGQALRVETLRLRVDGPIQGGISYRTYIEDREWQDWVKDGALSGTVNESKRMEALQIQLTGTLAEKYDVAYRVHVQNIGWQDWVKNGETAGTMYQARRIEAVQIKLEKKNTLMYAAHVKNIGWQDWVTEGETAGTVNLALPIEAFMIKSAREEESGNIEYRAHVQDIGWQDWVKNGEVAGTVGRSLRMEGIEFKLTETLAEKYDIRYRTYVRGIGWQDWAENGETAGTVGQSKQIEAIEVSLKIK